MRMLNDQNQCHAAVALPKLSDLINTWLQPGESSNETHQPFQRLAPASKTVETVSTLLFADTGLKPGVNEKTTCIFHAL